MDGEYGVLCSILSSWRVKQFALGGNHSVSKLSMISTSFERCDYLVAIVYERCLISIESSGESDSKLEGAKGRKDGEGAVAVTMTMIVS